MELDRHFAETRVQLAFTLERLGGPGNVEPLQLALEDDPRRRQANYLFGKHLAERGRRREAIAYLRKAVTPEDEKSPWFYNSLAVALRRLGEGDEALVAATRGLALAEQNGVSDAQGPLRQLINELRQKPGADAPSSGWVSRRLAWCNEERPIGDELIVQLNDHEGPNQRGDNQQAHQD